MLAGGTAMRGVADGVGAVLYDLGGISLVGVTSGVIALVVVTLVVVVVREPEQT
jgi:hypothetical protein